MKTWSLPLAMEAVLCAGLQTLCAPLGIFALLAPMELRDAVLVVAATLAATLALLAYWQLALATIVRKPYRFGSLFWAGLVCSLALLPVLTVVKGRVPWAIALSLPLLSGAHFACVQARRECPESLGA